MEGRSESRDDWLDAILRSVGLEPSELSHQVKMHFVARLAPLVEPTTTILNLAPTGTESHIFQ